MSEDGSVTHWIHQLKAGDSDAAHQLLGRYYRRLIALARKKLRGSRRAADEEDVVQNAFAAFCRRARLGQFARLDDRNDLLRLLLVITARKAIDQRMKENCGKRGRGGARRLGVSEGGGGRIDCRLGGHRGDGADAGIRGPGGGRVRAAAADAAG